MSKELIDICRVRVKFSETDAMQRVWHGSYVTYFEDGRESFGRHYPGIGYADIQRSGIYAPVYDLHVRYLAPLVVDDVAEIHTRYVPKPGARLDFEYEVYRECSAPRAARPSSSLTPPGSCCWTCPTITPGGRSGLPGTIDRNLKMV